MAEPEQPEFARERHVLFLEAMASELPADYASQEVNHLTLAYFAVAGLSLLRELDSVRSPLSAWSALAVILSIRFLNYA